MNIMRTHEKIKYDALIFDKCIHITNNSLLFIILKIRKKKHNKY